MKRNRSYRRPLKAATKPRKPFELKWAYPTATPHVINHKARKCEAVERDSNGKKMRDKHGKTVKHIVRVKGYTQIT
jgi:hypothetical protein